jgi:hypothetical protein
MKATKEVTVIATYYHKNVETGELTGVVTHLVRASNGVDTYTTTLIDGKATGCSCAARGNCYHKRGLEAKAVARKEVASQFSAKHAPSWFVELVAKGVLVAPKVVESVAQEEIVPPIAMDLPDELKGYRKTAVSVDISTKGNLNGQRGFNLLKVG